jgi:hypothetical protein
MNDTQRYEEQKQRDRHHLALGRELDATLAKYDMTSQTAFALLESLGKHYLDHRDAENALRERIP